MAADSLTLHRYNRTGKGYVETLANGVRLTLMLIPAGEFWMGSSDEDSDGSKRERPRHRVRVPQFLMGQTPVTQAQYESVMESNPAARYETDLFVAPDKPVVGVSWNDAVEFCQRLSAMTGKAYRLPSEAEWEYACRAETETAYHFGPQIGSEVANYSREIGQTTGVKRYPASRWGLYDMHGNVWEWCQDVWHSSYKDAPADGSAWRAGGEQTGRVRRGGSWAFNPSFCRSACRYNYYADSRDNGIGFRVVCSAPRALQ